MSINLYVVRLNPAALVCAKANLPYKIIEIVVVNVRGGWMAKHREVTAEQLDELCLVAKALSSPVRIEILKLLYYNSLNVGEIAQRLDIPASSAALHIKVLESAQLINTELQPGTRGSMKLCSRKSDFITIRLHGIPQDVNQTKSISMPIGNYTDCMVQPTCGLAGPQGGIGHEDDARTFFLPERVHAQLLWTSSGFVEYQFPNLLPKGKKIKRLWISMEICSEAPNYREEWKSDITLFVNGQPIGVWTSPGDFGKRRGWLNPQWWENGNTQYGRLTTWEVAQDGGFVNGVKVNDISVSDLAISDSDPYIKVRVSNQADSRHVGGFNIFGKAFGDYEQDIVMGIEF